MPTTEALRPWSPLRRLALAVLAVALGAAAAEAGHGPEPRKLVAVFPEGFPPIYQVTGNNVATGFGIDLMEALAARAKLHIEYRPVRSWTEAVVALRDGDADLIPNFGITAERGKLFDFSRPFMSIPLSVYVRAETDDVDSLDDLIRHERILATVDTNIAQDLLGGRTVVSLRSYATLSEAFVALHTGDVDALIYPESAIEHFARQLGLSGSIRRLGPPLAMVERAVAVRKGNEALLATLNREIAALAGTENFQAMRDRWYGVPPPFWSTVRVLSVITGLLILMLLIGVYVRLRLLRNANAFNSAVLSTAVEGILTLDTEGQVCSANPAAERIFRRSQAELLSGGIRDLLTDLEAVQLRQYLQQLLKPSADGPKPAWDSMGRRADDVPFPIRLGIAPMTVGGESLFVCTVHDLTDQRHAEREAEFLADHDPVTGLLNERGILLVLTSLVEQARIHKRPLTCIDLGIERFAQINDMYGRRFGDAILVQVGEYLHNNTPGRDRTSHGEKTLVARLGGNRFLIVLPDTSEDDASAVAGKLLDGLARLNPVVHHEAVRLSGKIGIACYPAHGTSAEELVSRVDITLRQAQQHPLDAILVFNPALREQETHTHYLLQRLHSAIDDQRLVLHFQPVLELASNTVHHYEALVRMLDTDGTLLPPGEFIPVAEKSGLITRIDYRVLELAFSHLAGLEATGRDFTIAVNISGEHLGDDALLRWLTQAFSENSVSPERLLFEITETTAVRNLLRARAFMEPLKALGCRFALDDFGVGFTTFAHLRSLPVDMIKIDGSFVRDLPTNPENHALVKAMTEAAHSLGKQVTAEYTESAMVLAVLRELGVDYAQGFYIGRPGPEFTAVIPPAPTPRRRMQH